MVLFIARLHTFILIGFILFVVNLSGQTKSKVPVYKDYQRDSSFNNFRHLRYKVAYAQINLLKEGVLLVRLKTNSVAITKLTQAGKLDLAKNLKTETDLENKIIMDAYKKEFTFCPVYFFYSQFSDSIRKSKLTEIFVDSSLQVNSKIVCNASFFLVAEQDILYNSSLGIVSESAATRSREKGTQYRHSAIVVKNKYFIQLHKPFPHHQIKSSIFSRKLVDEDLLSMLKEYRKVKHKAYDYKRMKIYRKIVSRFNDRLTEFYEINRGYVKTDLIKEYVY